MLVTQFLLQKKVALAIFNGLKIPLSILLFMYVVYSFATPKWQSNDDVMMAMVAHGYGFIKNADPRLLFSNVIWGHFAQVIPSFFNIQGYSWLTLGTLAIAAMAFLWNIERSTNSFLIAAVFVVAVFVHPLIYPQFTTLSGLATGAGVISLLLCNTAKRDRLGCVFFVLLVTAGFLIRWRECILILIVLSPFLAHRALLSRRAVQGALASFILVAAASYLVEKNAYATPEWRAFSASDSARVPYTDNRLGQQLENYPELREKHGYSENDIKLISLFFFVDQEQLKPERLNALSADVPTLGDVDFKLANGRKGITALSNPALLSMNIAILVLLLLKWNTRLAVSCALFVAAIFVLGFLGRPGVIRVYYPIVVSLLCIAVISKRTHILSLDSFFETVKLKSLTGVLIIATLCSMLAANLYTIYPFVVSSNYNIELAKKDLPHYEDELIYIWGGSIPFELLYPVWSSPDQPSNIYALGVSSYAPYAVPFLAIGSETDMALRFEKGQEITMVGYSQFWEYVDIFCNEHYGGTLEVEKYKQGSLSRFDKIRCKQPGAS